MQAEYQKIPLSSARDILSIIFKHKYKILIVFLAVTIGVGVWAKQRPIVYEAKTALLLKFGREFIKSSEVGGDRFALPPEAVINTEIRILTSKELLTKVISSIGLETIYPESQKSDSPPTKTDQMEAAVGRLMKALTIQPQSSSGVIDISFTHRDRHVAVTVLKTICALVTERHLEVFGGNSTPFLEKQMSTYEGKLSTAQDNLEGFRQKEQVFSLDEQRTLLIQQRAQDSAASSAAQNQVKELQRSLEFVKSQGWVPEAYRDANAQLAALEQRERDLLERYTENSSPVQNLRNEIQATKNAATRSVENARRVEVSRIEGELNTAITRAEGLTKHFNQVDRELRTLDSQEKNYQKLRLEVTTNESNYQNYLRKLEEARVSDSMDRQQMANISIFEEPRADMTPKSRGNTSDIILMGLLGGMAAGIAFAFLLEFISPVMTTPMSAERRLGIPVMVAITKKE
jgi:polysaccharide biosynthesis protein PslE